MCVREGLVHRSAMVQVRQKWHMTKQQYVISWAEIRLRQLLESPRAKCERWSLSHEANCEGTALLVGDN